MDEIIKMDNVSDYNDWLGLETFHPLISVINLSDVKKELQHFYRMVGFYTVYLKDVKCGDMRYGRNYYDYQKGTLIFIGPGQISGIENDGSYFQPSGYALLFHPDLIRGSALGRHINDYTFFNYEVREALHLSNKERVTIIDCLHKIDFECQQNIDKHSKTLIISYIELFLNYCARFYDRQFITRENVYKGNVEQFENLLNDYFRSNVAATNGLPTVAYFAEQLNFSPKYFGDIIKKETGKSAQEYIQTKVIDIAKERIFDIDKSISEVAYELGFAYPQHFTRLFKQKVGMTPNEYRSLN